MRIRHRDMDGCCNQAKMLFGKALSHAPAKPHVLCWIGNAIPHQCRLGPVKGPSWTDLVAVSLLLGPIATLLIVILPSEPPPIRQNMRETKTTDAMGHFDGLSATVCRPRCQGGNRSPFAICMGQASHRGAGFACGDQSQKRLCDDEEEPNHKRARHGEKSGNHHEWITSFLFGGVDETVRASADKTQDRNRKSQHDEPDEE